MCGIAGILARHGAQGPQPGELRRMVAALRHRGPDGFGLYLDDHAGLAHARLAIIDLAGGAQPLSNEDGTVWVCFNGEIFNYIELRSELEEYGHVFRTRSDTEVIAHAYEQWGDDAWRRFNGQFAIAVRDSRDGSLWLVRDRVGIAPLFYTAAPDAVVFGSEAKATFASGRTKAEANPAALAAVFTMWSAPGPDTVFKGVHCVQPGTALRFDRELRVRRQIYYELQFSQSGPDNAQEAAEELGRRLRRAIAIRLRADVPVGAYLSGGLDSSVISRLVRTAESSPLQTFSVRFEEARFDEGEAQRRMARDLGTTHHEIVATPDLIREALPRVVRHAESPLLRTAPVPMFLLSSLVRRLGMKVVLTGEGADEFLGGYDVFKEDKVRRFWARRPDSPSRAALMARVHPYVANNPQGAMWREFFRRGLLETGHPHYSHRLRWENTAWTLRFLSPEVGSAFASEALQAQVDAALPTRWRDATPFARAQQLEIGTFMTPYLLAAQGDRAIMAHGVEGRYPFLDPDVIGFCSSLPDRLKMSGLREKVTLRALARTILPAAVAGRRKWPFRAPIAGTLFGREAPGYVRELLTDNALAANPLICAATAAGLAKQGFGERPLGEREEMALVGLLTLQLWTRAFLDGSAAGSADEVDGRPNVWEDHRAVAPARSARGAGKVDG